jgi:hypothetical protein
VRLQRRVEARQRGSAVKERGGSAARLESARRARAWRRWQRKNGDREREIEMYG